MDGKNRSVELAAQIVAAYVGHNTVPQADLPRLIADTVRALDAAMAGAPLAEAESRPPVSIKKSVTSDYIICLEDGKKFKSLKRHLRTHYNLTPDQYREKWGLPADYPMVAPHYAAARSKLARRMGLGQKRSG
ncbi:MucR family transcriptional regulator [Aestuariivirga sp.]|uniref:MucR family transcriptional regulator n=1 Tax=Aestuariivirga sp. TaxID=2650926 RepID=UPI0039E39F0B